MKYEGDAYIGGFLTGWAQGFSGLQLLPYFISFPLLRYFKSRLIYRLKMLFLLQLDENCMKLGTTVAAIKIGHKGARGGLPNPGELNEKLRSLIANR